MDRTRGRRRAKGGCYHSKRDDGEGERKKGFLMSSTSRSISGMFMRRHYQRRLPLKNLTGSNSIRLRLFFSWNHDTSAVLQELKHTRMLPTTFTH